MAGLVPGFGVTRSVGRLGRFGRTAGGVARWSSGLFTFAFCYGAAAIAWAQQNNPFDPKQNKGGGGFKAAPKPPEPEDAEAAAEGLDYIMGVHVNTIFFVVAVVIGIYWFTMGGGRKPKVSRDAN